MIRKFAIAAIVVSAVMWLAGMAVVQRSSDGEPVESTGSTSSQAAAAGLGLQANNGLRPWPEIIEIWQTRSDANPLDYLSRTNLGTALASAAAAEADAEMYGEAELAYRDALRLNDRHAEARLGLASVLSAQHRFDEAADELAALPSPVATGGPGRAVAGDAAIGAGQVGEAAAAFERLVTLERSAPTVSRLARVRYEQGRGAEAVVLAKEVLTLAADAELRPDGRAFYHFQLGHFLFAAGRTDEAIDSHRQALALDPGHQGAGESLAFALAAAGRLDEAAIEYRRLTDGGTAADLHGHYAEVLSLLGRHDEAAEQEELARTAADEAIDDPLERRHLIGYLTGRDPERALILAREDLAERPDATGHHNLAWALHHAGLGDEAAQVSASALGFGKKDAASYYQAAVIANDDGRPRAAIELLMTALETNPRFHHSDAGAAADLLARLQQPGRDTGS